MYTRRLSAPNESFFLLGPRGTGKSFWLKEHLASAFWVDLLKNSEFNRYLREDDLLLRQCRGLPPGSWVVIDEVQRIPALLNDVHSLIAEHKLRFALSGSSARKLKKGEANLLAGRAASHQMHPLCFAELGQDWNFEEILQYGLLPGIYKKEGLSLERLEAYVGTYLREEIHAEALVRNLGSFSRFLEIAAVMNGQITNLSSLARDSGVQRPTVTNYFEILIDTLIARRLPAWTPRPRVKEKQHPKFYFFDTGVVRCLRGELRDPLDASIQGNLLETYIFHELNSYLAYSGIGGNLSYWRMGTAEVDFVWQRSKNLVGIEVKSSKKWPSGASKNLRAFAELKRDFPQQRAYGIYSGTEVLHEDWGEILPLREFLQRLWKGQILEAGISLI